MRLRNWGEDGSIDGIGDHRDLKRRNADVVDEIPFQVRAHRQSRFSKAGKAAESEGVSPAAVDRGHIGDLRAPEGAGCEMSDQIGRAGMGMCKIDALGFDQAVQIKYVLDA